MIVILMGVCGCGKTSVANSLAHNTGWPVAEADDYHPASNIEKMAQGIPLTDEDRLPWLNSLHSTIQSWQNKNESGIVTCSALKRSYRDILRCGKSQNLVNHQLSETLNFLSQNSIGSASKGDSVENDFSPRSIKFVYLKGNNNLLLERVSKRKDHYMPASLLQSQLDILEEPSPDENAIVVDVGEGVSCIVEKILSCLENRRDSDTRTW